MDAAGNPRVTRYSPRERAFASPEDALAHQPAHDSEDRQGARSRGLTPRLSAVTDNQRAATAGVSERQSSAPDSLRAVPDGRSRWSTWGQNSFQRQRHETEGSDSDSSASESPAPQPGALKTSRQSGKLPDWIYHHLRSLPKIIHHLHVKGSTPLILLIHDSLRKTQDIRKVPDGRQLQNDLSIHGHKSQKSAVSGELMAQSDLATYQVQYAALTNIAKTPSGALLTYYQLMLEQAAHGVEYAEFRTGLPASYNPETFLMNCLRGCEEAQRHLAIEQKRLDYGILVLINRGAPKQINAQSGLPENIHRGLAAAEQAIALRRQGYPVVGIDLAGNELDNAVTDFAPVFQRIHDYNADVSTPQNRRLGITIHAGETETSRDQQGQVLSGYDSVAASVELGWSPNTPLRIGHGVRIIEHPAVAQAFAAYHAKPQCVEDPTFLSDLFTKAPLLKTLLDRQICLETCPTSNVQTSAVASYEAHPALFFEALGLSVTINPDNTIISRTDATNEFVKLFKRQGFYMPEKPLTAQKASLARFERFIKSCYQHGVRAAFIFDELQKQRLLDRWRPTTESDTPCIKAAQ